MAEIIQISLTIRTGSNALSRDHRVFLGFTGRHGREFRCREVNGDGNPFISNSDVHLIFGRGKGGGPANVENPDLNDPENPQMDDLEVGRAYIRIDSGSEDEWLIVNAKVEINNGIAIVQTHQLRLRNITLCDDGSERVYLD